MLQVYSLTLDELRSLVAAALAEVRGKYVVGSRSCRQAVGLARNRAAMAATLERLSVGDPEGAANLFLERWGNSTGAAAGIEESQWRALLHGLLPVVGDDPSSPAAVVAARLVRHLECEGRSEELGRDRLAARFGQAMRPYVVLAGTLDGWGSADWLYFLAWPKERRHLRRQAAVARAGHLDEVGNILAFRRPGR